jgi:hypothetical protein
VKKSLVSEVGCDSFALGFGGGIAREAENSVIVTEPAGRAKANVEAIDAAVGRLGRLMGTNKGPSNPKQPFRIAMRNPLPVAVADWRPIEKGAPLGHRLIGMVGRKHDAVDANLKQEFEERRQEVEAGERVVDVLSQIEADWLLELGHRGRMTSTR